MKLPSFNQRHFGIGLAVLSLILALYALFGSRVEAAERWAIVGDGTLVTIYEDRPYDLPDQLVPAQVQRLTNHTILNLAGSGTGWAYNTSVLALRLEASKALGLTGVIINVGQYDWVTGQNLTVIRTNLTNLIAGAKAAGLKVVCLTPFYRNDWATRKGPNPGQVSARGNPLFTNPANPGVPGYANLMGAYCTNAGAEVIVGRNAPVGLANLGPLNSFTRYIFLRSTHDVVAPWLVDQMRARGHWL